MTLSAYVIKLSYQFMLYSDVISHSGYCLRFFMQSMSKPSSLFGDKLLLMNYERSKRHSLMSVIEYPVV